MSMSLYNGVDGSRDLAASFEVLFHVLSSLLKQLNIRPVLLYQTVKLLNTSELVANKKVSSFKGVVDTRKFADIRN